MVGLVSCYLTLSEDLAFIQLSCLRKFHRDETLEPTLPPVTKHDVIPIPEAVLEQRPKAGPHELMIHWEADSQAEASLEAIGKHLSVYPLRSRDK